MEGMARQRERTMTGDSSIGSFATYVSHENNSNNDLTTDTMEDGQCMPTTPVVSDMDQEENVPLEQQVQEAQFQATDALHALRQLSEGIQIITRQMKHAHNVFSAQEETPESKTEESEEVSRERSWSNASTSTTMLSCTSNDERRLSDLSRQLEGSLGADLMSLSHAAQMVNENSRMASQEASQSVRDVFCAQQSIQHADKRANKAESAVRIMYKKQKELIGQLEKTKKERDVLKRQVKALLQEKAVMKEEEHTVRALELHVVSALQAHEKQLAMQRAKRDEENKNDDSGNVATVRLECNHQGESTTSDKEVVKATDKAIEPQVREDHFFASLAKEIMEFEGGAPPKEEKFVNVAAESTTKPPHPVDVPKQKADHKRGRGGFGSAIGFGGLGLRSSSFRKKHQTEGPDAKLAKPEKKLDAVSQEKAPDTKSQEKTIETKASEKTLETKDEKEQEPALISPTNSVDGPTVEGASDKSISTSNEKNESGNDEAPPPPTCTDASITTDGISPCNQATLISPSPTESSTLVKGFFHRSSKEQRRSTKANAVGKKPPVTRKPLLQLDDDSVDVTEGTHDYSSASDTVPISESSAASLSSCDGNIERVPPKSLSCDTTGNVSPIAHEFATGASTTVLDDKAFRSLALPSFVAPSPTEAAPVEIMSLESPMLPPELAEIAEIYAEIGQLHEC